MKKLLLCAVAVLVLLMSAVAPAMAEEDEACPCGEDEMGECLPCE